MLKFGWNIRPLEKHKLAKFHGSRPAVKEVRSENVKFYPKNFGRQTAVLLFRQYGIIFGALGIILLEMS